MTVDRDAAQAVAQRRHLAAVQTPGQREANVADLQGRVRLGNEAHGLKTDPRWAWYANLLAGKLAEAEEDLRLWLENDGVISPMEFNDAVLAHQKTMRALARERVNFLRWAIRAVDDAIAGRDKAEAELARLRPTEGPGVEKS